MLLILSGIESHIRGPGSSAYNTGVKWTSLIENKWTDTFILSESACFQPHWKLECKVKKLKPKMTKKYNWRKLNSHLVQVSNPSVKETKAQISDFAQKN